MGSGAQSGIKLIFDRRGGKVLEWKVDGEGGGEGEKFFSINFDGEVDAG